ncbi:FeoB small GTPase domain-containing protein [Spirochaeta dissipatitropha]
MKFSRDCDRCHSCGPRHFFSGSDLPRVLLMGMPNVGKSVLFGRLTGLNVAAANFAGTTVEYTSGSSIFGAFSCHLQDVPGVYSLKAANQAEQVAVSMLESGPEAVILVLDALNLEASIALLLQVRRFGIPMIAAINRIDLLEDKQIDYSRLQQSLQGVPCIPVSALLSSGIEHLKQETARVLAGECQQILMHGHEDELFDYDPWPEAEELCRRVLTVDIENSGLQPAAAAARELDRKLVSPFPGIPVALGVMATVFAIVIGAGMGIRRFLLLPILRGYLFPLITGGVGALPLPMAVENILIGEYGVLIKGIEWPFALVFPYVISFYAAFALLEDSGYLPRLAVLLDGLFRRIGIGGSSIIPLLLGYGCGIPAIMASRALPSQKQRLIVTWLVCLAVPCVSQTGAFIALLAEQHFILLPLLFLISFMIMAAAGLVLDRILPGVIPPIVLDLPPMLRPNRGILAKKILMRCRGYIADGAAPMALAILGAAILYELHILHWIGRAMEPLVSGLLKLPSEASVPLLLGIIRRELTVLPLLDMDLSTVQLMTGSVVALMYIPCIAMVVTTARELGVKTAMAIFVGTTAIAFALGGLTAHIGGIFW